MHRVSLSLATISVCISTLTAVAVVVRDFAVEPTAAVSRAAAPISLGEAPPPGVLVSTSWLPGEPHANHLIGLAYNWNWQPETGWVRPDPGKPSAALHLESWYGGLAELNLDLEPPSGFSPWAGGRALGFEALYDGTFASLTVGGSAYRAGAAGVTLTGGTGADPLIRLKQGSGEADGAPILRLDRSDGRASLLVRGGANPHLSLAFGGEDAAALDGKGAVKFSGPIGEAPFLGFDDVGVDAILLAAKPEPADRNPRFVISATGALAWGDGQGAPDAGLFRSQPGRIATQGELATQGLILGDQGSVITQLRVLPVQLKPTPVAGRTSDEQRFRVPQLSLSDLVFLNAPAQAAGLGVAGARVAGEEEVAITFVNLSATAVRPTAGIYTILALRLAD
ncbi:MAG: hypothetical protein ACT4P2_03685 [Pseudomonadota bacterium]